MILIIIGRNFVVNQRTRNIIDDKLGTGIENHLQRFSESLRKATIRVEKRARWGYEVTFSMWLPGNRHIFAREEGDALFFALSSLKEKIQREIAKNISG
ncbi:MAG: HPF/RaiA family ribosome-associated protein [Candidatus Pacebacteria bacterium]|nr:HPF/RaiA family ribosome-associated protein [Candidatus Paceibacterota bacterium]